MATFPAAATVKSLIRSERVGTMVLTLGSQRRPLARRKSCPSRAGKTLKDLAPHTRGERRHSRGHDQPALIPPPRFDAPFAADKAADAGDRDRASAVTDRSLRHGPTPPPDGRAAFLHAPVITLPSKDAAARAHGPAVEWADMLSISGRRQTAKREGATLTKQIGRMFDPGVARPVSACKLLLRDFRNGQGRPWFLSPGRRPHTGSPGVLQPEGVWTGSFVGVSRSSARYFIQTTLAVVGLP
jgi:hypothetical protein